MQEIKSLHFNVYKCMSSSEKNFMEKEWVGALSKAAFLSFNCKFISAISFIILDFISGHSEKDHIWKLVIEHD